MAGPDASSQHRSPFRASRRAVASEMAAEFLCEIGRYAGEDTARSVQRLGTVIERHDRSRPTDDLDREALWRMDEASVPWRVSSLAREECRLTDTTHASGRHIRDRVRGPAYWRVSDAAPHEPDG